MEYNINKMFTNNFGEIYFHNSELILIIGSKYTKKDFDEYINKLESIYISINSNFSIKTDISKVYLCNLSSNIYYKIISLFTTNYKISEEYLSEINIICSNRTLIKILNNFFYLYRTPHPIKFKKI